MARIRSIKPEFFLNDELASLPFEVRLLFVGLWTQADKAGRMIYRPARLKASLFPYDDLDPDSMVRKLAESGFVTVYEAAGVRYLAVDNFERHQSPHHKESDSTLPAPTCENALAPDKHGASTVLAPDEPLGGEGKGREGKGTDTREESPVDNSLANFPDCFSAPFGDTTLRTIVLRSLAECFGEPWAIKPSNRGRIGAAIRSCCPPDCNGITAESCAKQADRIFEESAKKGAEDGRGGAGLAIYRLREREVPNR